MKGLVLDTNVLVSGLLSSTRAPGRIVDAIRAGSWQVQVDDRILREYRAVLRRPYFERYLTPEEREWILEYLERESQHTVCGEVFTDLPDPQDSCFLEVAHAAAVPLVTGNLKHFPATARRGVPVHAPAEFAALYLQG